MKKVILSILGVVALIASDANAKPIMSGTSVACSLDAVRLTAVAESQDGANTNDLLANDNILSTTYDASDCAGFYGNDDGGLSSPNPNTGIFADGLLNGQADKDGFVYFPNGAFISPSDLLDIDGLGGVNDPGWIHLAGSASDANPLGMSYSSITTPTLANPFDIGSVLDVNFSCGTGSNSSCTAGSWSLSTKENIVSVVQSVLGRSTFDHLAISLKVGKKFVVYDFNFKTIFGSEALGGNNVFDFLTAYTLGGTFSTKDLTNKHGTPQAISHINVWARDPIATEISEPAVAAMMSLLALVLLRRRKP